MWKYLVASYNTTVLIEWKNSLNETRVLTAVQADQN